MNRHKITIIGPNGKGLAFYGPGSTPERAAAQAAKGIRRGPNLTRRIADVLGIAPDYITPERDGRLCLLTWPKGTRIVAGDFADAVEGGGK